MADSLYAVFMFEGIRPELRGPFKDDNQRLRACKKFRNQDEDNLVFWLNIGKNGLPRMGSFGSHSMEEGDAD